MSHPALKPFTSAARRTLTRSVALRSGGLRSFLPPISASTIGAARAPEPTPVVSNLLLDFRCGPRDTNAYGGV